MGNGAQALVGNMDQVRPAILFRFPLSESQDRNRQFLKRVSHESKQPRIPRFVFAPLHSSQLLVLLQCPALFQNSLYISPRLSGCQKMLPTSYALSLRTTVWSVKLFTIRNSPGRTSIAIGRFIVRALRFSAIEQSDRFIASSKVKTASDSALLLRASSFFATPLWCTATTPDAPHQCTAPLFLHPSPAVLDGPPDATLSCGTVRTTLHIPPVPADSAQPRYSEAVVFRADSQPSTASAPFWPVCPGFRVCTCKP